MRLFRPSAALIVQEGLKRSADCGFGLSVWSQTALDYASTGRYVANHLFSICIVGVPRAGPNGLWIFRDMVLLYPSVIMTSLEQIQFG